MENHNIFLSKIQENVPEVFILNDAVALKKFNLRLARDIGIDLLNAISAKAELPAILGDQIYILC